MFSTEAPCQAEIKENFNAASSSRLATPLLANRSYPTTDQLLVKHKHSGHVDVVVESTGDGEQEHQEIVEIRNAIIEETSDVLIALKNQEVSFIYLQSIHIYLLTIYQRYAHLLSVGSRMCCTNTE
ncbi:hypothetical protein EON65_51405 [archaeon]|nr:MAG: hypothetical protein EON65_51405 [archaeon]